VGTSGRGLCLLSGGIDSPVAAYLMMTRGMPVDYIYFHSYPYIGAQSLEKVRDLARILGRFQPRAHLHVMPFTQAQLAIRDHCPEGLRTLLYRRLMNHIANAVAERVRAGALITGESLGQVASQTMPNIAAIEETAALPVLRPLIGLAKREIIDRARHIGTYETSIQPFPDCCTLFLPAKPETNVKVERLHRAEEALDIPALVAECINGMEIIEYGPEYAPANWDA